MSHLKCDVKFKLTQLVSCWKQI